MFLLASVLRPLAGFLLRLLQRRLCCWICKANFARDIASTNYRRIWLKTAPLIAACKLPAACTMLLQRVARAQIHRTRLSARCLSTREPTLPPSCVWRPCPHDDRKDECTGRNRVWLHVLDAKTAREVREGLPCAGPGRHHLGLPAARGAAARAVARNSRATPGRAPRHTLIQSEI